MSVTTQRTCDNCGKVCPDKGSAAWIFGMRQGERGAIVLYDVDACQLKCLRKLIQASSKREIKPELLHASYEPLPEIDAPVEDGHQPEMEAPEVTEDESKPAPRKPPKN